MTRTYFTFLCLFTLQLLLGERFLQFGCFTRYFVRRTTVSTMFRLGATRFIMCRLPFFVLPALQTCPSFAMPHMPVGFSTLGNRLRCTRRRKYIITRFDLSIARVVHRFLNGLFYHLIGDLYLYSKTNYKLDLKNITYG